MTVHLRLLILFASMLFFIGGIVSAPAQPTGTVAGRVVLDRGEPATGATVMLDETKYGTSADTNGSFTITGVPEGSYRVRVRLVGFEQTEPALVSISAGTTSRLYIRMRQSAIEMNAVVVTGSRRQEAEDVRPSVSSITPRESKILPGGAEDVLRALQALPGVTSVSDFSSQLVVRGSGPDQNLMLIDGFEVLNPYRLYGFVSMFNPETVSDISLQTGGFAAQYGDRLSSVIDVRNREGRSDRYFGGKFNASLTNMNVILEGGLPLEGASYLVSLRRTYYDLILGPVLKSTKIVQGDVALPNFRDLQAKVAVPLNPSNKVLVNAFVSRDGIHLISGADRQREDSVSVMDETHNSLFGATWQFNPVKNLVAETQASWYRNSGTGAFDGTFVDPSQNTGEIGLHDTIGIRLVRLAVSYDFIYEKKSFTQRILYGTGGHALELGYGLDVLRTDYVRYFDIDQVLKDLIRARGFAVPTSMTETLTYNRYSAYVQDKMALGDRLFFQPGLRLDVYPLLQQEAYLSPRFNISYKLDDLSTIRGAYGIYYQSPGMEKEDNRGRVVYTHDWFSTLVAEQAEHYVLGYDRMLTPEWQFKVETYLKNFQHSIVPERLSGSTWQSFQTGGDILSFSGWTTPVRVTGDSLTLRPVNDATGRSYGVEFMLQKIRTLPADRLTGWVSYALSYADRSRDGKTTPFLFDQRHAANIVANYKFAEAWDLGARFTLRSGRPYTQALGVKPRILVITRNGEDFPIVQLDAKGNVILDVAYEQDAYSGRLNLYHTLDIRLTTYPGWWGLKWSFYLDVQNVYNHSNEQQVTYYIDQFGTLQRHPIYGIPIFPSVGMSLDF